VAVRRVADEIREVAQVMLHRVDFRQRIERPHDEERVAQPAVSLAVGDPTVAVGLELDVIAAVIIGGGSLLGGKGTVVGTVAGAAIMAVIGIGCSQQGLPNWVQQIVTGVIIVLAVALDRWRQAGMAGGR
jgi:predicted ABC-type sugar transport system permease subunit